MGSDQAGVLEAADRETGYEESPRAEDAPEEDFEAGPDDGDFGDFA